MNEGNQRDAAEEIRTTERGFGVEDVKRPVCGVVRPIADLGDYRSSHWLAVHHILEEAADAVGYDIRLVSESDSAGIILNHIVSNLYSDEIVICDVSGKNPNVMFELGMRIAFEKPVIVVADDTTSFSFDIAPLKHFQYPRSLRYSDIVTFKRDIGAAIVATLREPDHPGRRGYLQQFGPIEVTKLESQKISLEGLANSVAELSRSMSSMEAFMRKGEQIVKSPSTPLFESTDMFLDVFGTYVSQVESTWEKSGIARVGERLMMLDNLFRVPISLALGEGYLRAHAVMLADMMKAGMVKAAYPITPRATKILMYASISPSKLQE